MQYVHREIAWRRRQKEESYENIKMYNRICMTVLGREEDK